MLAIPFADRSSLGLHGVTSHWAERVVGATGEPPVASKPNDIWLLTAAWTSRRHFAVICRHDSFLVLPGGGLDFGLDDRLQGQIVFVLATEPDRTLDLLRLTLPVLRLGCSPTTAKFVPATYRGSWLRCTLKPNRQHKDNCDH